MPDIVNSGRGVMGFLRSLAGDLDREDAANRDIASYQQALRKNLLDNWHQGPPQQFYDQAQQKLQDPSFHSRVVADVVKASDPGIYDATMGPAAAIFTATPKGMAASYLAGLVADPSAANFANTAFQVADPTQAAPGGGFSVAGTPIARIPAGEQALARLKTYAKDAADIQKQLFHGAINARDRLFHATDTSGFKGILESGGISPNPWLHQGMGIEAQKQLMAQQTVAKSLAQKFVKHPSQTGWANEAKQQFVITGDGDPWASMDTLDAAKAKLAEYKFKNPETTFEVKPEPAETFYHPLHDGIKIEKVETGGGYKYDASIPSGHLGTFSSIPAAEHGIADVLKQEAQSPGPSNPETGVSVSRVPRISPKSSKAISFVLDPNEVPPMRPLAEPGYQKTKPTFADYASYTADEQAEYNALSAKLSNLQSSQKTNAFTDPPTPEQQAVVAKLNEITKTAQQRAAEEARNKAKPNKNFEYELRTFNEPIPLTNKHGRPVATEIWIDRSALEHADPFEKNTQIQLAQHPEYRRFIAEQAAAHPGMGIWENPSHKLQLDDNVRFFMSSHPQAGDVLKDLRIAELRQQAAERGLPLRVFPSGPAMHAARVGKYASNPAEATSFGVWGGKKPKANPQPGKMSDYFLTPEETEALKTQKPTSPVWWPDYVAADYEAGLLNYDAAQAKALSHGFSPNKDPLTVSATTAADAWNYAASNALKGGNKKAKKKLPEVPLTPEPPITPAELLQQAKMVQEYLATKGK
jgi:hypothetical protein